jgi:hypothetical protein
MESQDTGQEATKVTSKLAETQETQESEGTPVANEEVKTMPEKPQEAPPRKKRKRRPPLVPWKKPKDMPRRPLSAYNIFFKEQREQIMSETAAAAAGSEKGAKKTKRKSKKSAGIGFANLARTIAANWKDLDPESKAPYEAHASVEKDRYTKEMLVWRAKEKDKKKEQAASGREGSRSSADDSRITGTVEMDTSADPSSEEEAHHGLPYARLSPIPIQNSSSPTDEEPLPLESTKKTRLAYSSISVRRNSDTSGITPIRVPDLHNIGRWSEVHGHQSDSAIHQHTSLAVDFPTRQAYGSMGMGHGHGHGYQLHPSDSAPIGFDSYQYMDPWSGYMNSLEGQHLQQAHQQAARRYTWSGSNVHSSSMRYPPVRRNDDERSSEQLPSSKIYPDAWFEVEERRSPDDQRPRELPSSNIYPDTWFEAQDADADNDDEPIRYSPEGDLIGKLPPQTPSQDTTQRASSLKSTGSGEGKSNEGKSTDDKQVGMIRSLDELASDTSMRDFRRKSPQRESEDDPIVESSLHALGLQLDDETVDFITNLCFNGSTESNMEEDDQAPL